MLKRTIAVLVVGAALGGAAVAQVSECGYTTYGNVALDAVARKEARIAIRSARSLLTQAKAAARGGYPTEAAQDRLMAKSFVQDVCSRKGTRLVWADLAGGGSPSGAPKPATAPGWVIETAKSRISGARVTDFVLHAQAPDPGELAFRCRNGKILKSNPSTWIYLTAASKIAGAPSGHSEFIGWGFWTAMHFGVRNPYQFVIVRLDGKQRARIGAQEWFIAQDPDAFYIGKGDFKALLRAKTAIIRYTDADGDPVTSEFHPSGLNDAKVAAACGAPPAKW